MAYFPTSPIDGEPVTVNGILYTYNASKGAWKRAVSSINNLDVAGNITAVGNITAGNITAISNSSAKKFFVTDGVFWSGNGVAFASSTYSNANVASYLLTGANIGSGSTTANLVAAATTTSTSTTTGALVVAGGAGIAGNLWIANTGDVSANIGALFLGNATTQANLGTLFLGNATTQANLGAFQTFSNANAATQATSINTINANLGAYQLYANANIGTLFLGNATTNANLGTLFLGNATTQANLGTLFLGNATTQANLGAFQTFSNANAATQATSINTINANLGSFQSYANTKIGTNTNSNLVVVATTTSTSTTTGALVVGGGVGIAGALFTGGIIDATGNIVADSGVASTSSTTGALIVNGGAGVSGNLFAAGNVILGSGTTSNVVANATTVSTSTTTGALVVRGGAGVAGNVYADRFYTANGIFWSGNGAAYAAGGGSFTASPSAPVSPTLGSFWYKTTTDVLYEYINDGVTDYWIDIQTPTIAANTSGPSMYAGDVFGANITFTGTITGSVGYLIERANIVASAPPAVTNLDLITAPIIYFTSNTTQNITANIRGNSTVTLNSLLVVGQSSTFVILRYIDRLMINV
jgi:hypothetical protein